MKLSENYTYKQVIPWMDPLIYASDIDKKYSEYVFLHSSRIDALNNKSVIGFGLRKKIESLNELCSHMIFSGGALMGHLGYELILKFEELDISEPSFINTKDICMFEFNSIIIFHHNTKSAVLWQIALEKYSCSETVVPSNHEIPKPEIMHSNMTQGYYLEAIKKTIEAIHCGMFCQANITRSFFGYAEKQYDPLSVFVQLITLNPAPYSSIVKTSTYSIVSSSPEMFLTINNNIASCSLIKGSARRYNNALDDEISARELLKSKKDIAENLMVIDLMRNDMAKNSVPGSVSVPKMFELQSFTGIHHLVSTVTSQKLDSCPILKFICDCFPPGSVTGTPKIEAIKWCIKTEKTRRNAYCGSIGIISSDFSRLSVVIRTIILENNKFEFHGGGGITCLSNPNNEHNEVMIKIKRIANCLNVKELMSKLILQ